MTTTDSTSTTTKAPKAPKPRRKKTAVSSAVRTGKTVTVTLLRSTIGFDRKQGAVVRGLGLRRIRHTVEVPDTPAMRGMLHKVRHLVEVR
jgi:large subunit ribosomal protein L30